MIYLMSSVLIMNNCGHNATSGHSNNKDNNKIYALSSDCAMDNYTKLASLNDMGRTSSNYSNPPNMSHNRLRTAPNLRGSEDGNQGNNQLKLISTVGTEGSYNQVEHVPEASNFSSHSISGTRDHNTQEDDANDMGIITVNMSAPSTYHETYHQEDHIVDNSRHYHNLSQPYNGGHNKSNTIYSANSIHGNSSEQGKDMISAISTGCSSLGGAYTGWE